jgi:predicted nucleotidyltransferase
VVAGVIRRPHVDSMETSAILKAMSALPRVKGLFLSGSHARGTADAWSDLDTVLVVDAADQAGVVDAARVALAPTVMFRKQGGAEVTLVNAILPDWTRVDLLMEPEARFVKRGKGSVRAVHDPADLIARLGVAAAAGSAQRVAFATEEFLRVLGLLSVAAGRQEWVLGTMGAGLLRDQLLVLMKAEAGTLGEGMLHLTRSVSAMDYALLERMPPITPDEENVVAAHVALARIFVPRAKAYLAAQGLDWPAEFEEATRAHLGRALGFDAATLW